LHVKKINLIGFRNLKEQVVELADGLNLLVGNNGQGKTNFLEAVYLMATLRSFKSSSVRDVIRFGEDEAEVSGEIASREVPVKLRVRLKGSVRKLWVGQRSIHSAREFLGRLRVVAFTPDDLAMIKGGPSLRRKFLDRAAFLFDSQHLARVKNFNHALKSRNRLLKERKRADRDLIDSFSQAMAEDGARVSKTRLEVLRRLRGETERIVEEMIPEMSAVSVSFEPGWYIGADGSKDSLLEQIRSNLEQDLRRGQTCLGPQQDDFEISMGQNSARRFASQGQQRTVAVALLLAVVREVVADGGARPVILLDDVSSELDAARRKILFEQVVDLGGQVLITTTDEGMVADLRERKIWKFIVDDGRIEPEREK
jgi:DNA replication and repair protein RecF